MCGILDFSLRPDGMTSVSGGCYSLASMTLLLCIEDAVRSVNVASAANLPDCDAPKCGCECDSAFARSRPSPE